MDTKTQNRSDTRRRVLKAAADVFAEKGFERATVREIVERAEANLNAVNYYFRGKRGLYLALFENAHQQTIEDDKVGFARMRALAPPERLRFFLEHVISGFVLRRHAPWHARLMLRELIEPTWVLDIMVDRVIRPRFEELVSIIRDLTSEGTSELSVRLCAESVVAQCVHMIHGRAIVSQLIPELEYSPEGVKAMVEHITSFSLAALRNLPTKEPKA